MQLYSELIPIVDEMMPNELWENIKIATAKIAKRNYRANASGRNCGDNGRRNMKAHGKKSTIRDTKRNPAPPEGHACMKYKER